MEERVKRLEDKVRMLTALLVVAVVVLAAGTIRDRTRVLETLQVSTLQVVDGEGRIGIGLSGEGAVPGLSLFDEAGTVTAQFPTGRRP